MDTPEPQPDDASPDLAPPAYPPPTRRPPGRPWTIAGFVFAVLAFLFAPVYAGAIGAFCGVMGLRRGDPMGKRAIIASVACMVAAILLLVAVGPD